MLEESFLAQSAKVVGSAKEGVWAQVVSLTNLQAVVVLSDGEDGRLGREILGFLGEEDTKLEKKNLAELSLLVQKLKETVPEEKKLSLVLALPVGRVLYLASLGGAALLKRGEKIERVVSGEETASGFLKDGDLLILGSEQFFQIVTPQVLAENLNHFSPPEIAERLAPPLSASEENAGCAALILSFQKKEEKWVEEEAEVGGETIEEELAPAKEESFEAPAPSTWAKFLPKIPRLKIPWPFFPRPSTLVLKGEETQERKTLLTVALFLIILLGASIFFGVSKTRQGEQAKKFAQFYQEASLKYEEGKGLVGLNDTLARGSLLETKEKIGQIRKTLTLTRDQEKKIAQLEKGIEENLVILARVYKLGELPLFWETSFIRQGSEGETLAIFEERVAILDRKNRLVFLLSTKTKAVETLGGENLKEEPILLGLHGGNIYLFSSHGISRLEVKNKKITLVVEKDEAWKEPSSLAAYGGNLYLLDRKGGEGGVGQIWKYISTETGFSPRRPYLASDIEPDFSQAQDMVIDGAIWVLLPGEILKLSSGRPENFVISGLEGDFGQPTALFTNEKSQNLYLLDPQSKKVLVLGKDGSYQAQYEAEGISQARDLVVSEEEKKIFLLAGSKIYAIEIK